MRLTLYACITSPEMLMLVALYTSLAPGRLVDPPWAVVVGRGRLDAGHFELNSSRALLARQIHGEAASTNPVLNSFMTILPEVDILIPASACEQGPQAWPGRQA